MGLVARPVIDVEAAPMIGAVHRPEQQIRRHRSTGDAFFPFCERLRADRPLP